MKLRHRPHHAPRFLTLQPQEEGVTTLRLDGFRQTRGYTCGFATALMVMRYFGVQVPAMELFRRLSTGRDGTRQSAIVRELRAGGLRANVRYDMDFPRICRSIERNKLVVGYLADIEHWLVIYGYGRDPERVYVADPRPEEGCSQEWEHYGPRLSGFGIICSQPGQESDIRQAPLALADEPQPVVRKPQPPGKLRCEVSGGEAVPEERTQLALPWD